MKQHLLPTVRIYLFLSVLLGLGYPAVMTWVSRIFFPFQANGSLILREGQIVGSEWISQKFEKPKYFWPRPSAVDYNPLPSGGSNLGPISAGLRKAVEDRAVLLKNAHGTGGEVPSEMVFASASGLDPEISPEAARYQMDRVAKARNINVDRLSKIIQAKIKGPQLNILGQARLNVLELNLMLDQEFGNGQIND